MEGREAAGNGDGYEFTFSTAPQASPPVATSLPPVPELVARDAEIVEQPDQGLWPERVP